MTKSCVLWVVEIACMVGSVAHQPSAQTPLSPSFEVASVKPNRSGDVRQEFSVSPDGSYRLTNGTARMVIRQAYRVQDFQIVDAPPWTDIDRFDVTARAPGGAGAAAIPDMLQGLLRERFGLRVHRAKRDMPQYVLVVRRRDGVLGPGLRRTPAVALAECAAQPGVAPKRSDGRPCGIGITGGTITAGNATLGQLLGLPSPLVGRTAINKTQLEGAFDFELTWTLDQFADTRTTVSSERAVDPNGPSLFTALQEQLGLKLESKKGPVDVLVIDHVEHPTED
jgi:uncharacterized protein (TIGR03435 family)